MNLFKSWHTCLKYDKNEGYVTKYESDEIRGPLSLKWILRRG